jgi:aryl-alcohol dehydrogenase-like predicted oxidoreductase
MTIGFSFRVGELVRTSIDSGIKFFDTANNHTEGKNEKNSQAKCQH